MRKMKDFLKALGAFVFIMAMLLVMFIGVIAELAPTAIPDWMYVMGQIITIPFWIAFFVVIIKEWKKQRKAKKEK